MFARRSLEVADIVGGHSLSCLPASTLSPPGLSRCRLTGSVSPRLVTMLRFLSQGEVLGKSQDELINREFAPTVSKECVSKTLQFFILFFKNVYNIISIVINACELYKPVSFVVTFTGHMQYIML